MKNNIIILSDNEQKKRLNSLLRLLKKHNYSALCYDPIDSLTVNYRKIKTFKNDLLLLDNIK